MEVDSSLSSCDELNHEDFQLDLKDFIPENPLGHHNRAEEIELGALGGHSRHNVNENGSFSASTSPVKKLIPLRTQTSTDFLNFNNKPILNAPRISLQPDLMDTNIVTNELFQVTNGLRKSAQREHDIFNFPYEEGFEFFPARRLNNDKVEKLVNNLGMKNEKSGDLFDYELDDQLRTRFYKGRFNKNQFTIEQKDEIDTQLHNYLGGSPSAFPKKQNDNKENLAPYPDPLKSLNSKENNLIKKSNKTFFRPPRRNQNRAPIPVLKPLSNLANVEFKKSEASFKLSNSASPNRQLCSPRHRKFLVPTRPSIKHNNTKPNIFLVESSTGLINDATKFGTELNASNCEDFPLPEDINEIVQIPTNEDSKTKIQKMAIIKVLPNKKFVSQEKTAAPIANTIGFYNEDQFNKYREDVFSIQQEDSGVEVVGQSLSTDFSSGNLTDTNGSKDHDMDSKRRVRWAENLEW
ncbi:uncharacterized protein RJT20DRAFT_56730 [Scheffersomyces xylosifermentans]|uniref:uncharacterized protein n=1 Tax=Scheffersomyces xylosifermentans TaxID=1304137 RepID=UPI00315CD179